jgi:hypothetical protein
METTMAKTTRKRLPGAKLPGVDWDRLIDCDAAAAAIVDRHPQYIPTLIRTGRLDGRKIGGGWVGGVANENVH